MGGGGETGPAEVMGCMDWGNIGGVDCPPDSVLSRPEGIIGEPLGGEGRVIRGSPLEGDV